MPLKEEQFQYGLNVFVCLPTGDAANSAVRCQKTTLVQREECLCRDNVFFCASETVTIPGLWPYQWMKHTVSQSGEFIARYCLANDNDIYVSAPLPASFLLPLLSLFLRNY